MEYLTPTSAAQSDESALASVGAELAAITANLDVHFVGAGSALGTSYDIAERLVTSLESVTTSMNRQAAAEAVETMRLTADRLTRLPTEQRQRQSSLDVIFSASAELVHHLSQIRRTLSFLQICGLNIKVTAAGADGFASFADHMFAKLDQAGREVDAFEAEINALSEAITAMVAADRLLADECASIVPRVPEQLLADALSLQGLQEASSHLAKGTSALARDIRTKVGVAIGALQIGDITRQRLEHIAQSITLLEDEQSRVNSLTLAGSDALDSQAVEVDCAPLPPALTPNMDVVRNHISALLTAQANDTLDHFLRETASLTANLRGIAPDASRLAAMQHGDSNDDVQLVLRKLEENIEEVASVTRQLSLAEADSTRFGHATSEAAESLRRRLKAVNRIQRDVEQMAWNTALQCRGLGEGGRGIAVISSEIHTFSGKLATIWEAVAASFGRIEGSAAVIANQHNNVAEIDTTALLVQSLATIKDGSARMAESLHAVDREAVQIGTLLNAVPDDISCEAELAPALVQLNNHLRTIADHHALALEESGQTEGPAESAAIAQLMAQIATLYTMASERDVHRAFDRNIDQNSGTMLANAAADDGLFDDDLFDDGLF